MARDYNIGLFTERVCFLKPFVTISGTGEREVAYLEAHVRYCEVTEPALKAEETQEALAEEQTYQLKTWTVRQASTAWRVCFGGVTYDIIRVSPQRYGKTYYTIRRTDLCNE